jgi:O-succinylbenzoic acid--CoA ligase
VKPLLLGNDGDPEAKAAVLEAAWQKGRLVGLAAPQQQESLAAALGDLLQQAHPRLWGPAVVLGSGGSSGGPRWCLQPLSHLEFSAEATGHWLRTLGIDPAACLHLNPLPLHHVSGLLPLVRARRWGARLRCLPSALLRNPWQLLQDLPSRGEQPVLLSLVPTQLQRLMASPDGVAWLAGCSVIWVGGAALSPPLASAARRAGLPLAPCYGATETAAMVCAMAPRDFLAGQEGCGSPLEDVQLRIDPLTTAVEVRCHRLSPGCFCNGRFEALPLSPDGWWRSGDGGRWEGKKLRLTGRLDGAIHSGGETVFPEQLEARLLEAASQQCLPLAAVLLLTQTDPEWGERLVALVGPEPGADAAALLDQLQTVASAWVPAERPRRWCLCPALSANAAGKWERGHWRQWLDSEEGGPGRRKLHGTS